MIFITYYESVGDGILGGILAFSSLEKALNWKTRNFPEFTDEIYNKDGNIAFGHPDDGKRYYSNVFIKQIEIDAGDK